MEMFSALLAFCERNPPGTGGSSSQMPVKRRSDVFFDLYQNKRLSKQSIRRWPETPLISLWRHCNAHIYGFPECQYFTRHSFNHRQKNHLNCDQTRNSHQPFAIIFIAWKLPPMPDFVIVVCAVSVGCDNVTSRTQALWRHYDWL